MFKLPIWKINNIFPAVYDMESATAIEQTAKLHGAMQTLIDEYNEFAKNINVKIDEFIKGNLADEEIFRVSLRQEFQDFIDIINLKILNQNNLIQDLIANGGNGTENTPATVPESLIPFESLNGAIISHGERIYLEVGKDVEVGQTLKVKYKAVDGYNLALVSGVGNVVDEIRHVNGVEDSETEYIDYSFTIYEHVARLDMTGFYFVLVPPIPQYEDGSGVLY